MFLVGVTGFGIKPLRDFRGHDHPRNVREEVGPRIRWAAGVVIVWAVSSTWGSSCGQAAEFLVQVTGLNIRYLELTMTVLLLLVAVYTILGGMLSVLGPTSCSSWS